MPRRLLMVKYIRANRFTLLLGFRWSGFGIGFNIDKYSLGIDLGPCWIGLEW
jgi:hypothetical protein